MKKFRMVLGVVLLISTLVMNTVSVSAAEANSYDWEALSLQTGLGIAELKSAHEALSTEEFEEAIQVYTQATMANQANLRKQTRAVPMSDGAWRSFRSSLNNGSILITQDNKTSGFRHGHAAIISGMSNTTASDPLNWTIYFTEHPGSGTNNGLSWRYLLNNQNTLWWRQCITLASFNYKPGSTILYEAMNDAGDAACSQQILNKPYNVLGPKTDSKAFNCSSLVWRCYINGVGVDLAEDVAFILPVNLAKSNKLSRAFSYGQWVNW